jgi:hypothetical protein
MEKGLSMDNKSLDREKERLKDLEENLRFFNEGINRILSEFPKNKDKVFISKDRILGKNIKRLNELIEITTLEINRIKKMLAGKK